MKVKEMNLQERPREKALAQGIQTLSNRELIAILLRNGTRVHSALDLADLVLHTKEDLVGLLSIHLDELMRIPGIKEAKAIQLLSCFELCQRISLGHVKKNLQDDTKPQIISDWLMKAIGHETQEHFIVIFLDNRGKMISYKDMFVGTLNKSFANPREVFMEALHHNCNKIICAHNHPSGDVTPSKSDYISAEALEKSGDMLGVKVVDHIIVGQRDFYSFREQLQMHYQKDKLLQELEKSLVDHDEKPSKITAVFPSSI